MPYEIAITLDFSDDGKKLIKELIEKIEKNEKTTREAIIKDEINRLRAETWKQEEQIQYAKAWCEYCKEHYSES